MQPTLRTTAQLSALALAALLSACGGGGGGTSAASGDGAAAAASTAASDPVPAIAASPAPVTVQDLSANPGDAPAQASTSALVATPDAASAAESMVSIAAVSQPTLTVRARADLAANVGAIMQVRVDGNVLGSVEVRATEFTNFTFTAPTLKAGSKVDVVFTNDGVVNGQDRNLYVGALTSGAQLVLPTLSGAIIDRGVGAAAFDGKDTVAGQPNIYWGGALRLTWPAAATADSSLAAKNAAARLLMQGSFGPTAADVARVATLTPAAWIAEQQALPFTPSYVNFIQTRYDKGDAYRPGGAKFDQSWLGQAFWASAAQANDQLRRRMGWALYQIFMVSASDSNLWSNTRAHANYLDTLNKHAFGNYRTLIEEVALSPAMGIYLSHMRNRKEDPATGRVPDENFARELMQLFSIGLYELNTDGTTKLGSNGKPIETYTNADVMALAKVFTGWSWAYPDAQLTEANFRWGTPSIKAASDTKYDLLRMKAYPGQHSTVAKTLFAGKTWQVTLPANASAADDLRVALDTLFRHPNVGPFIGRQLIQRLVMSHPSPAYVERVAKVFNNNGAGVRGDLGAVVKAILLDAEARTAAADAGYGKLREPVLRVAHWMRATGATSSTGEFKMAYELANQSQQAIYAPSVFGYYRPGYVPPTAAFASAGRTAPELQIVNETSTAAWVNLAQSMSSDGLGWTGSARDVAPNLSALQALSAAGNLSGLVDQLNLLLFAGRMPADLRQAIVDAALGVGGNDSASHLYRAKAALFMALASNEYQTQR